MRWIVTGPESSGKTTLCQEVSNLFGYEMVEEYARYYIDQLERPYKADDLITIADTQIMQWNMRFSSPVIFDTDLLTTMIWHQEKYNFIPKFMTDHWINQRDSFYFLCAPDLKWEPDPQRENPGDRDRLFAKYFHYLNSYGKSFKVISGLGEERIKKASEFISKYSGK